MEGIRVDGTIHRTELEARWGIFLRQLGVNVGYLIPHSNTHSSIPQDAADFMLFDSNSFIKIVESISPTPDNEWNLCGSLVNITKRPVIIIYGEPAHEKHHIALLVPHRENGFRVVNLAEMANGPPKLEYVTFGVSRRCGKVWLMQTTGQQPGRLAKLKDAPCSQREDCWIETNDSPYLARAFEIANTAKLVNGELIELDQKELDEQIVDTLLEDLGLDVLDDEPR